MKRRRACATCERTLSRDCFIESNSRGFCSPSCVSIFHHFKGEKMRSEVLLLLRDDDIAQRLVVVWPDVEERTNALDEWASLAGVLPSEARQKARALLRLDICRADGTVDEIARQFCLSRIAAATASTKRVTKTDAMRLLDVIEIDGGYVSRSLAHRLRTP